MSREEIANQIHSMATEAGIVVLIWTRSDVIEVARRDGIEISAEDALEVLTLSESEIHERLWHQAKPIFEVELQTMFPEVVARKGN